jgi:hypothetical protein
MPRHGSAARLTRTIAVIAVAAACASPARAQAPAPSSAPRTEQPEGRRPDAPVRVRTFLDRTAVWVADRLTYTVEIVCARGVDILDEDLAKDKLKLDGLDLLGSRTTIETAPDGTTTHRYTYVLTTYGVDRPALTIAPISVRYFVKRSGQRLEDAAPAGEVEVPAAVVAFRSMLPDAQESYELRDTPPPAARLRRFALARPVGLGLVIASIVPVAFVAAGAVRRRRGALAHRSAKQIRQDEQTTLEALRAIDLSTPDGRREAYTRMNEIVRAHLSDACGVAGQSLTPLEVEPALTTRATSVSAGTVTALLSACELARYAPETALPSADQCRAALDQTAEVLATR